MIDTKIMKRNLYYFKYGTVRTDYKSFAESSAFSMEDIFSDSVSISVLPEADKNLIFESGVYFSKELQTCIWTYAKIQDLAATVGGIIKIFFIITNVFMSFYSENNILFNSLKAFYRLPPQLELEEGRKRRKNLLTETRTNLISSDTPRNKLQIPKQ